MDTGSGYRPRRRLSQLARTGAVLLGLVTAISVLVVGLVGPESLGWKATLVGVVVFAAAYIGFRITLAPRLVRAEKALERIEGLVRGEPRPQSNKETAADPPVVPMPLVDRLEQSADDVAARLAKAKTIENYRQEFLGDVSHELQTPIFAVQGFAETLLDGALEDPSVNRPFVEKILRHSERLSTLVNDLSHISRIETGSLKMNLEVFDPKAVVNDAVESLELTADSGGITLFAFVAPDVGRCLGDRVRIRQVLDNLINNGIKYNDRGGRVEVAVRLSEDGRVLFSITDDGIGLAPEHFDRVTERFFRVDKSRSRERGGTGLGLAIVKHILEAHGTSLRINSDLGRGSTFGFELDSAPEPAEESS